MHAVKTATCPKDTSFKSSEWVKTGADFDNHARRPGLSYVRKGSSCVEGHAEENECRHVSRQQERQEQKSFATHGHGAGG
jgi:hypothetical protein